MSPEPYTDCVTPNRPYLLGVNLAEQRAVIFRPRCKMWSCPYCAQVNRSVWAMRAMNGASQYQERGTVIDFLTVTSHERLSANATLAIFPEAWKRLAQRARRKTGGFDYLLIPERHEDGRLHIHAIETASLGTRWWKDNARQVGLGFMNEEETVRTPQGAANYVVKYVTKTLQDTEWPKGFRRVRTSRKWPKLPDMPPLPDWDFKTIPGDTQINETWFRFHAAGFDVRVMGSNEAWLWVNPKIEPGQGDDLDLYN